MGWTCSAHVGDAKLLQNFICSLNARYQSEDRHRREKNVKINLREIDLACGLDSYNENMNPW